MHEPSMAQAFENIPGTVSNLQLIAFVHTLDRLGVDANRVLAKAGLKRDQLDPKGRSALAIDFPLWNAAVEVSGDPAIGLRLGKHISYAALGGYGYLLRNSETFEKLLERASEYIRLIDDLCVLETRVEGDYVITRMSRGGGYPMSPQSVDCAFAAIAAVSRELGGPGFVHTRVRLAYASAIDRATYERYFGCPVELDAQYHELEAPKRWLHQTPHLADARLGEVLEQHAQSLLESLPSEIDTLLQTAREKLAAQLEGGEVGLGALARAMYMSERTLRRRLSERGTSYQALLDELRATQARKLVGHGGEPVDRIAQRLGFADTSSFFHAFKRWTGQTPAQFRRGAIPRGR